MNATINLNPCGFETLNADHLQAVNGGGVLGDALIATGGAVIFSAGVLLTLVGAATLNGAVIGAGVSAAVAGAKAIGTVVN